MADNIQKYMLENKLEYAKNCGCDRCKEIVADYATQQAPSAITPQAGFNLSKEDLDKLLSECLKPEEISGDPAKQLDRIDELIHWFKRFATGNANPKWFHAHAFELVYYIATTAPNRFIDLEEIRKKAYFQGVNITSIERTVLEKLNLIPLATSTGPMWIMDKPTENLLLLSIPKQDGAHNKFPCGKMVKDLVYI